MNLLGAFRHYSRPLGRAVVVLFAASWLGLAVQPCAASGAHDAGEPAPGMPGGDGHNCPHCPPPADESHDCSTAVALDCAAVGEPAVAAKTVKAPDAHHGVAIAPAMLHATLAGPGHAAPSAPPDPARCIAPRTLQQRYCTYLE